MGIVTDSQKIAKRPVLQNMMFNHTGIHKSQCSERQ